MGWVTIRGYRYYRKRLRIGSRVRVLHLPPGPLADHAVAFDAAFPRARRGHSDETRQLIALARLVRDTDRLLAGLFAPLALSAGLHLHRRQYRRIRGFTMTPIHPPNTSAADTVLSRVMIGEYRPSLDVSGLPEADRRAVAAAARGDPAGMARARELLANPALAEKWGNTVHETRVRLIIQVAGTNPLAFEATNENCFDQAESLGWSRSTFGERLMITRIIHNWLTLQALENRATELAPESPERLWVKALPDPGRPPAGHGRPEPDADPGRPESSRPGATEGQHSIPPRPRPPHRRAKHRGNDRTLGGDTHGRGRSLYRSVAAGVSSATRTCRSRRQVAILFGHVSYRHAP